jgi:integrase
MENLTVEKINEIGIPEKVVEKRHSKCQGLLIRVQPKTGLAVWYYEHRRNGRKHRIKIGAFPAIKPTDAMAKADKLRTQVKEGGNPAEERRIARRSLRLSDLVDLYLEWAKVHRPRSAGAMEHTLRVCFEGLKDKPVLSIDIPAITSWRTQRKTSAIGAALPSAITVNKNLKQLRAMFNWATTQKLIPRNPIAGVELESQDDPPEMRPLSHDEEAAILKHIGNYRLDFQTLFVVALDTGGRRGELLALTWNHVDLKRGRITLIGTTTKSKKTRHISLTPRARLALETLKAHAEGELVFPMSQSLVGQLWRSVAGEADVFGVRFHDLRHSFGTRLALLGVPTLTIKSLMGHSTIRITERYLHAADSSKDDAIKLLGGVK